MTLPSGTVTFLFTDIEGSTRLWEQHPEAMRLALARHDAIAAALIPQYSGLLVKSRGEGDSLFCVFACAADALSAAWALQQAFGSEPWPVEIPLRVRMALHTGETDLRDEDYYGPAVNRCARLRAIGHGGQVLLSQATYRLLQEHLPEGCVLQDKNAHRLKDLQLPEHVFQLLAPGLAADFPPLRSLQAFANNLPIQLTSFIGREKEQDEVKSLLARTRLLTLMGSGGCGKTRLALQMAVELVEDYADGVWLVELAALSDPALAPQQVVTALGLREEPGRSLSGTLTDHLQSKTLLLVLDNCEHLVEACARLAGTLISSCAHLKILATSREALNIAGETTYRVPSLLLPDPKALPLEEKEPGSTLFEYDSVRLFVERASAHRQGFTLTRQNGVAVAEVCSRLDGIPLAIELAAARVKVLSVKQIAARLEDRFQLLTGGSRTALPRQQTLRAAIDWSYDLLSEQERLMLNRVSVFAGSWSLEAAEQVCAGEGIEGWEVLDLLTGLVDKSLVIAEERTGTSRYHLLETVRQYSRERLAQTGEEAQIRGRHRDFFLALAEEARSKLTGPEQGEWLARLEEEHDNLRAALGWCGVEEEGTEAELRLAEALRRFWDVRGHYSEGRAYLTEALGREGAAERTQTRARALNGAGALAQSQGDYGSARANYEESLSVFRELGGKQGIAQSLNNLGLVACDQGDYGQARALHEESLAIQRELRDKRGIADSLNNLGIVACAQGDYGVARVLHEESLAIQRELGGMEGIAYSLHNLGVVACDQGDYGVARALCEESLAIKRELGDKWGIAYSLNSLGIVACAQGDYGVARALCEESLAIRRELGDKDGIAYSLNNLGLVACDQGDYEAARALLEESLTLRRELRDKRGIADSLEAFANLARALAQPERAARAWAAAEALREEIESPLPPNERQPYDRNVATAREALGEEAFAAAWAEGRSMTLEQAIAYALKEEA